MTVSGVPIYPVRVEAQLDPDLSRWLWLVKWFLAIPHYIVLAFLWAAFAVLSIVAFFAILFTGRYPRSIFAFNVGVLRWSWRVSYYSYGALATDRYPPFTLDEVPDYPAHLEIVYPEHLSRGLVLVKWWLLAIPHYLIVGILAGGIWMGINFHVAGGLISLLAIVAALILAFSATYPQPIFDLILGLNRWVLRVAAYTGLMTDEYPPFRLDQGGSEPGETLTVAPQTPVHDAPPAPPRTTAATGSWGAGRVIALVIGILLILPSMGVLAGGGALLWGDLTQRDAAGYIHTGTETFSTGTYAITSPRIDLVDGPGWFGVDEALGTVRIRVAPSGASRALFVGIAATADVDRYLAGVGHAVTNDLGKSGIDRTIPGAARPADPRAQAFWVASSVGTGERTLTWTAQDGDWSIVALNADRTPGMVVRASLGATVPHLRAIAIGLLAGGGFFLILGVALVIGAAARRERTAV